MKIALHAHVFYPELWPELAKCIRNFPPATTEVFLTFPDVLPDAFAQELNRTFPEANVRRLENRGYDVGPFIDTLHHLDLDTYDLVVKLHTKRNRMAIVKYMPYWGAEWRRKLLGFCATEAAARRTLAIFESDPKVGMVGHGDLIMHASDELSIGAPSIPHDQDSYFVAGTMFAVRAKLLKPAVSELSFHAFPIMQDRTQSELAWSWERKLGRMIEIQGYSIYGYPRESLFTKILSRINKTFYTIYDRFR